MQQLILEKKEYVRYADDARHSNSYNLAKKIYVGYDYIDIEKGDKKFGGIFRNG